MGKIIVDKIIQGDGRSAAGVFFSMVSNNIVAKGELWEGPDGSPYFVWLKIDDKVFRLIDSPRYGNQGIFDGDLVDFGIQDALGDLLEARGFEDLPISEPINARRQPKAFSRWEQACKKEYEVEDFGIEDIFVTDELRATAKKHGIKGL